MRQSEQHGINPPSTAFFFLQSLVIDSVTPLLTDVRDLDATLLSKLQPKAIGPEKTERVARVRTFVANPAAARNAAISTFVTEELFRWKEFFDTIESKPLTAQQRPSVVAYEDATLVLAGAGSGKSTLTILASNARPSAFVTELVKDPAYEIVQPPGPDQEVHECGECGGRLLSVQGQDGRTWYRCKHSEHCGNFLPVQNAVQPYRGA